MVSIKKAVLIFSFYIIPIQAKTTIEKSSSTIPIEQLQHFVDVYHQVKTRYVNVINDEQLLKSAIKGMLQNLDPHSNYLSNKEYKKLQETTSGEFAGLGVEVAVEGEFIKIVSPINNTPAEKAGLLSGDLIIKVDDVALQGLNRDNVLDLLQGKEGSHVKLLILRDNKADPLEFNIVREIIEIESITSKILSKNYVYIKISHFQQRTASEFSRILRKHIANKRQETSGILIDLRNNPGGLLDPAIHIADYLLSKGLITYTQGQHEAKREDIFATQARTLSDSLPIVVLINGGTASSSEVLTGALKEQKRAIIVGTKTFGKGSIQALIPLDNGGALKLTTAKYFTPSGRSIQAEGIKPDIIITAKELIDIDNEPLFNESSLQGHLKSTKQVAEKPEMDELALKNNDYQLYEALNILKTMSIINKKGIRSASRVSLR